MTKKRPSLRIGLPAAVLGLMLAIVVSPVAQAAVPTVTEVTLAPGYVTAGQSVTGTLQLSASDAITAQSVGIAVRDSHGVAYDYPGTATNVSLGPSTYTFTSGARTFAAGTYTAYGFWQDTSSVYHSLPSTTLTVAAAVSAVNEVMLSPGYVAAGSSVRGTLQLTSSSPLTAQSVGIAVRDSHGVAYDYPGAATNVSLGPSTYTFTSSARTFAAGTYTAYGFWQDTSSVYHDLPATTLTVGQAVPVYPALLPKGMTGSWTIRQADEFDGTSLDTTKWQAGWFGSGVTGPANPNEQACYSSDNVAFPNDGNVHLKVTAVQSTCGGSTHLYTGALLSTNGSDGRGSGGYEYTYGALEARVYIPASGTQVANWPAVWTDGHIWPTDGEDDVFEGLAGQACYHFHSPSGVPGSCVAGNYTGWHTFGSDWEPGSVTYYYDGVQVGTITTGVTASPMYLLLDNSVSASVGGPTVSPADMQVDYIRVWQH